MLPKKKAQAVGTAATGPAGNAVESEAGTVESGVAMLVVAVDAADTVG